MVKGETRRLELPMSLVGEQDKDVVVPFDQLTVTQDESVLAQIAKDERDEKFIYAYSDSGVSNNNRDWSADVMSSMAVNVLMFVSLCNSPAISFLSS